MHGGARPNRIRSTLDGVARLIQFRSEVAIGAVLLAGVAAGGLLRAVTPVPPTPSASFASPGASAARAAPAPADRAPTLRSRPARPSQLVSPQ